VKQHVISKWLLKAFGRHEAGRVILTAFDKSTGEIGDHDADEFMVEADAHSNEIEDAIERLETPAAAAAMRLVKRTRHLPRGLYAVMAEGTPVRATGTIRDVGVRSGMRLQVPEQEVPSPSCADRLAIANYAGLMYQRSPKVETAILQWGRDYDHAAQEALSRRLPGLRTGLSSELARRRARMAETALTIGQRLAAAEWFVVRADPGAEFVLSDSPVSSTLALGFADEFRPLLADTAYVVVVPLNPALALLIAPMRIIPTTGVDAFDAPDAVNRFVWRSADRYVLARDRATLEAAFRDGTEEERRARVSPVHDSAAVARAAEADVDRIVLEVYVQRAVLPLVYHWPRWGRCRLDFGAIPGDLDP
jgi:hypothetical protein